MLLFGSKLGKTYHHGFSKLVFELNFLDKVSGVTRRIYSLNLVTLVPQLIHVVSCPARVGSYLICKMPTEFVKIVNRPVIDQFQVFGQKSGCLIVVLDLSRSDSGEHVSLNEGVVRV